MKTVLITGGKGLVGSQLYKNVDVLRPSSGELDLVEFYDIKNYFLNNDDPDVIIHTAAKVGGIKANTDYPADFFTDNILMNTNVLRAACESNVKKVVSFLSTCVFPDDVEYPLTEQKIHLGPPHESNYAYAYAKRMVDIQSRAYRKQYGLNAVCIIPTNIYGPNDNFNVDGGHVIPGLIHKCFLAKQNNTNFEVWGSGEPLREFIHSKDVANITEWVVDNYDDEEPLIVSTGVETSIKKLVDIIVKKINFKGKVIFNGKMDGQMRKPSDNSKLKNLLPGYEFITIEDGIDETVEWFIDNYPNIRK